MALTAWLSRYRHAARARITPDEARELLAHQLDNRPLDPATVTAMVRTLRYGESLPPLVLREDGRLVDGQHRLAAVVALGDTITLRLRWLPADYERADA